MYLTITVTPYTNDKDKLLGFANVEIDNKFALENVRIKEGNFKEFVDLPKYQVPKKDKNNNNIISSDGKLEYDKKDVFNLSDEVKTAFENAILEEYHRVMLEGKEKKKKETYQINGEFNISKVYAAVYNREFKNQLPIRGFATVYFGDDIKLEKVRIKEGEHGLFVDLPKYRTYKRDHGQYVFDKNGEHEYEYRDCFHAITTIAEAELSYAILDAFNRAPVKSQSKENAVSATNTAGSGNGAEDFDPLTYNPDFGKGR